MSKHAIETKVRLQNDSGKGGDWYDVIYTYQIELDGFDERSKPIWIIADVVEMEIKLNGRWFTPDDLLHDMLLAALDFTDDELFQFAKDETA